MTIKNRGGVFGRNPTFNNVDVDGTLSIAGTAVPAPADTLTTSDIGSTVQAYDADTAKLDVAQTFTAQQDFPTASATSFGVGVTSPPRQFTVQATGSGDNLPVRIIGGSAASQCYIELHDAATTADYNVRVGSAGDDLELYAGGSNRLDVRSNGDVSVQAGNLVIGTSGKGIDFSATSGTGTSELFDDYEEGTWTPNQGPSLSVTGTFGSSGTYTKIGNRVFLTARLTATVSMTSVAGIICSNLPFVIGAGSVGSIMNSDTLGDAGSTLASTAANTSLYSSPVSTATGSIQYSISYLV
jgi:hypothetical protein